MSERQRQAVTEASTTHGMHGTSEYRSWDAMLQRCGNSNHKAFSRYGARGITVCPEWKASFLSFFLSVGHKPTPRHTLERIDNSLGYGPGNCRWATPKEQSRNTRTNHLIEWDGQTKTIAEWAEILGLQYRTLHCRIGRGWPLQRAMTSKLDPRGSYQAEQHGIERCGRAEAR